MFSLQTEKSAEGAGPLRSVKSDGQADERTATVNSVSNIIHDLRNSGLLCLCDSSKQMSRNCGSISSYLLFFHSHFSVVVFFLTSDTSFHCRKVHLTHQAYTSGMGQTLWVGGWCVRHRSDSSTATASRGAGHCDDVSPSASGQRLVRSAGSSSEACATTIEV